MKSIYEFKDYKEYLKAVLSERGKGAKTELAKAAECQSGYVTHVLKGTAHFSLEQIDKIARAYGLDDDQTHFFLNLTSFCRAGTYTLRQHFQKELDSQRSRMHVLKNRLKPQAVLTIEDQAIFYSSWHYGALHAAVAVPGCETEKGLANFLGLPLKRVNEILPFLEKIGMLIRDSQSGKWRVGTTQSYIGSDSPMISKFHTNWRLRAIESLDRYTERDLHYSAVISISSADVEKVREMMVKTIEDIRAITRASKDEECFSYAFDLFSLKRD